MREIYKGPLSFRQQQEVVAAINGDKVDLSKGFKICSEVVGLLKEAGFNVEEVRYRVKSAKRIKEKVENPIREDNPVLDIYGIQLVMGGEQIEKAVELLREKYPMPSEFPWGLPTLRNGQNIASHSDYSAIHLNVMFDEDKIAEIKLMTAKQAKIEKETRACYEANRRATSVRILQERKNLLNELLDSI